MPNNDHVNWEMGGMPIPTCRHQARKWFAPLSRRLCEQSASMDEYVALCRLYIEVAETVYPAYRNDACNRDDIVQDIQTELENQGI